MIILGAFLVLSSCSPDFYCKRCPSTTIIKDSIIVETDTIWKDTIVTLPQDTVSIVDTLPCPDYEKEIRGLRSRIKVLIKDHKLTATCTCDSIEIKLAQATIRQKITHLHSELRTVEKTVPRKKTWWSQTVMAAGYTFLSLLLLAIVYGIFKFIKFIKPKLV